MPNKTIKRFFKFILLSIFLILILVVGSILFIRSPWGQSIIVEKASKYVSQKTNSTVEIGRLFVTFSGNIQLDQLFLDDLSGDTLFYSESLEASLALIPLITDQQINLDYLKWDGLIANIKREEETEDFNFTFFINAFASEETDTTTSSSPPPDITIGQIQLRNIKAKYLDQWLGLESHFHLNELSFEAKQIDLTQLLFEIEALRLSGTSLSYLQTKPLAETPDSSQNSLLPHFIVDELSLENISVSFESIPDQVKTRLNLGELLLEETKLNLNRQKFVSENVLLENSFIDLRAISETSQNPDTTATSIFEWPDWEIDIEKIELISNRFHLQTSEETVPNNQFNPEFIKLDGVNLLLEDLHYSPENLSAQLESLSLEENKEFKLKNLSFYLEVKEDLIDLSEFQLLTANNNIQGQASMKFQSFQKLIDQQSFNEVTASFPQFNLNAKDAFYFIPELRKDTLLSTFSDADLIGQLNIQGDEKKLNIAQTDLKWGKSTQLKIEGSVENFTDIEYLRFDLKQFKAKTNRVNLLKFVSSDEIGFKIPNQIELNGKASGMLNDLKAKMALKIPEGGINIEVEFANKEQIIFDGNATINRLAVGKLLNNPQIGIVSFNLNAKGRGNSLSTLTAKMTSEIDLLELNGYDYSALELDGTVKNGSGVLHANFKDYNLNAALTSKFNLDTTNSLIDVDLNVIGADLYALGLSSKRLKTAFQLQANFSGSIEDFEFNADLNDNIVVYQERPYTINRMLVDAKSNTDTSSAKINSDFLTMNMHANVPYSTLLDAIERQFNYYLSSEDTSGIQNDANMQLYLSLKDSPLITEIISDEIFYDSIQLKLNFNQENHQLKANLTASSIRYKESSVDSILFSADGNREVLQFSLGFLDLNSGLVNVPKTSFSGELKEETIFLDFIVENQEEKLMQVKSEIQSTDSTLIYHINPEGLILNNNPWAILPQNEIRFTSQSIIAQDFELDRNGNHLSINSSNREQNKEVLNLSFDNFQLSTLTGFLNTEDTLASGIIKGELTIENPKEEMGLVSDLNIENLEVLNVDLGKLRLDASAQNKEQYKVNLALNGKAIDLTLNGDYTAKKTEGLLDFNLHVDRLEFSEISELSAEYFSKLTGTLSATADLTGTTAKPKYEGKVSFKNTSAIVNTLNAPFKLPDESIHFSTDQISLNDFLIQDQQNNSFHLDGKIITKDLLNPSFDLSLKADQFQLLNSTAEDNELFFGKVDLNTNLTIEGDLTIPIVRGSLSINENSSFTYVVPEEELDIMERDGTIVFVNKENPDAILTRNEESESSSAVIKGYDLNASLKVDKNVDFKIIVDQRSGDNLKIKGNGDFKVGLEPNGRTTLSGRYELNDGYYEASLYNIVKRRFDIANGSSIVWRGNPLDAEMNLRAIYRVETSASGLMASKTSGQGFGTTNDFRQKLPFLVYLNLDGELLQPKISFQLDMPEASQGQLGGKVYSRVQQLNSQEDELNKQVFSLLVLNQFFPTSSNDGSSGGSAAVARGNVNKVLEDQLNNFSGKYLGKTGLELDFGVDSYTDYQGNAPQNKTQLDLNARKKLFNDKLIVQVGSGVSIEENSGNNQANTPVVGNVSLEYLFTENGRWRIKGFRKNEFESVIEGQLIVTGISLIFQREFNQFKELLEEIKKEAEKQAQ